MKDALDSNDPFLSDFEERLKDINREMADLDYRSGIQSAYEEGYNEGLAQGKAMRAKAILEVYPVVL